MNPSDVAWHDQLEAAAKEVTHILRSRNGEHGRIHPNPWLKAEVDRIKQQMTDGTMLPCAHAVSTPGIVVAFAAVPGRIFCTSCAEDVADDLNKSIAMHMCDECNRYSSNPVRVNSIALGPFILQYGLCKRCHSAQDTHAGNDSC